MSLHHILRAAAGSAAPIIEGFEDSLLAFDFVGDWERTDGTGFATQPRSGGWCYTNLDIGDNTASSTEFSIEFDGSLSFWYAVSSESGYDFLRFYKNGVEVLSGSGIVGWTNHVETVAAGDVVKWTYEKDGSVSENDDAGFIDDIVLSPEGAA